MITDHYLQQQKLDKLISEQSAIINNPLVGICTLRDRKVIWSNSAFNEMLGYYPEELYGRSSRQLYAHEEDFLAIGKVYANIERDGALQNELEFVRKDGQKVWVDIRGSALHGEASDFLWILVDVTKRKQSDDILLTSETKFRTLFESSSDAILMLDEKGFFDSNQAALNLFGLNSQEQLRQYHPADLSPPKQACGNDSRTLAKHYIDTAMQNGTVHFDWLHKRADTEAIFVADITHTSMTLNGKLLLQTTIRDITERKHIEESLRIAASAFETQDGIMVTDANNVILRVNKSFTTITGYSEEEAVGQTPGLLSSGRHDKVFYMTIWESLRNEGAWSGEIWNRRKNGDIYPEYLSITEVQDSLGSVSHYVASLTDITKMLSAEHEIQRLAFFDTLTNLPNRRLFFDRLKQALTENRRTNQSSAILFLDLDDFKILNDTLGHDMGDLLLQKVADRLSSCVRESDTVARLGGDEFVVLLKDLSMKNLEAVAQARDIAEKILFTFNKAFLLGTDTHQSTSSIGISLCGGDGEKSAAKLLKEADIAMYHAKAEGRNTLRFFDPKMQEAITIRASMEQDLRKAIEQNQFQLHYQIQVDSNGQALGAEALIRWFHPARGMISPFDFIPIAEATGLILPIGQWVLDTACAQLKKWQQNPLTQNLIIAVNVSAKQFHHDDFVEQVLATIARHDINATRLKLELTESMLVANISDIIIKMDALSKTGIQFSLDDFGTGYSSLQYLKKLPLNQLKIDQSFVRDIVTDASDRSIVRTIITMAHSLDINVIAEGVETAEQRQFLLDSGCTSYQGYLFSKPVSIDEFEVLLKKG
jgi:diguanylate cyclase (GGDEF)-like protein/PAS domain S-box-containing protein